MTPKEFIDENYFSLTVDCKREINEIYQAIGDYAKAKQLTLTDVVFSEAELNAKLQQQKEDIKQWLIGEDYEMLAESI